MPTFLENCIYVNPTAICRQLCAEIIEFFEKEKSYDGVTAGGLNKNIKDTKDFVIKKDDAKWSRIRTFLENELSRNCKEYVGKLASQMQKEEENSSSKYHLFSKNFVETDTFMIQKYEKGQGRYIYHDDFSIDWENKKHRVITFLFYLNDVEEGGETEFWREMKIKPEAGKLLLFPCAWTYPHRGLMPKSCDKYILTGWLYLKRD